MKTIFAALAVCFFASAPALAQTALVVPACGGQALTAGNIKPLAQDGTGVLCTVSVGTTQVTATPTVTASSAYTAGNAVGGLVTLSTINRQSGASIYVQSVAVQSKSLQSSQIDVVFFNANPTGSTCTDKTAFSVATADAAKVVGVAHVSDWTASALGSVGQMQQPPIGIAVPATSLYACLVTRGTPTFTATSDISLTVFSVLN